MSKNKSPRPAKKATVLISVTKAELKALDDILDLRSELICDMCEDEDYINEQVKNLELAEALCYRIKKALESSRKR